MSDKSHDWEIANIGLKNQIEYDLVKSANGGEKPSAEQIEEWAEKYSDELERQYGGLLRASDQNLKENARELYDDLLKQIKRALYAAELNEVRKALES